MEKPRQFEIITACLESDAETRNRRPGRQTGGNNKEDHLITKSYPMSGIGKFFNYLFTGRFDKIIAALRKRIPLSIYNRAAGWIFELDREGYDGANSTAKFPEGYSYRFAERDELPECSRMVGLNVEEFYRRYDYGDRCYAIFDGNRPVNINWIHAGSCYVRGMGFKHSADEKEYYIYGIMTDQSQRGKGLYKNCLVYLAKNLFKEDALRLNQMVEDGNDAVLHTLPKLGYKKTRRIKHTTFLGIKKTNVIELIDGSRKQKLFIFPPRDLFTI
jgi:hypothetical protein